MKQTEIGLIPDDWEVKSLGKILTIKHGYGFEGDFFSSEDNGFIVVTPGNFKLNGGFQKPQASVFYVGKYPKEFNLKPNDLIIMMTDLSKESDTLGNPAIIPNDNYQYLHNQRIGLINCNSDDFDKNYLFHLLCLKDYHKAVVSTAAGSTVKHTSPKRIYSINLPITPILHEQQRIAKALSDVDALISTTEKLIQKKKNIKQGTMQELLTGKKRLPGFTKSNNTKMTELGEIPEDWEVKRFYELFDICTETIFVDSIKKESYIGTENMLQDKMGIIKNETALNYLKVREYRKQDILVSNIRPYLKKIWFADNNGGCSTDVLVFRKKRNFDNAEFLFKIVSDERFFNIVNDNAVGTKMPRGDKNIIKYVLFAIPTTKEEQTAIANVLSSMDKEIETLNTKLEKYRNLKTAMMQQLLTGKIRLK